MRRSICYCESNLSLAGEVSTWKFSYTTATSLPKGTRLKFDLGSRGREIDWEIPTSNLKAKKNMIWAETSDGKVLTAKEVEKSDSPTPYFEFTLPSEIKAVTGCEAIIHNHHHSDATLQKLLKFLLTKSRRKGR